LYYNFKNILKKINPKLTYYSHIVSRET